MSSWHEKVYNSLIERGKLRGLNKKVLSEYHEKHHIFPKCLGGDDSDENLVLLTYREHIIAHLLLNKLYPNNKDLLRAISFMLEVDRFDDENNIITIKIKNTKLAEKLKLAAVELNRGVNSPSFGKKLTDEHKRKISEANKGKKKSEKTKKKMSNSQKGKRHSDDTKKLLSKIHTGKKIHTEERKQYLSKRWSINNPRKNMDMTGKNNPSSIAVIGPDGLKHESIKRAATFYNISYDKLRNWIKNNPEKGFKVCIN